MSILKGTCQERNCPASDKLKVIAGWKFCPEHYKRFTNYIRGGNMRPKKRDRDEGIQISELIKGKEK